METVPHYRRLALRIIARPHRIFKRTAPLASKFGSVTAISAIVVVAVSLLVVAKLSEPTANAGRDVRVLESAPVDTEASKAAARTGTLAKRDVIVYVDAADPAHYHSCSHDVSDGTREAMTLELAEKRGLLPCKNCTDRTQNRSR